jgi:O-antigen ligase
VNVQCLVTGEYDLKFPRESITVTLGYFISQSVLTKTLSNFSYVGICRSFAHVYYLPDRSNSLKFKLLITTLNKNGHLSSYLLLFFSFGFLMMLKSPPTNTGDVSTFHALTNSCRKLFFLSSCAGPYTEIRTHWKVSFFCSNEQFALL